MSNYIYSYIVLVFLQFRSFSELPSPTGVQVNVADPICAFCQTYFLKGIDPATCEQTLCASTLNYGQPPNVQIPGNFLSV